MVSPDPIWGADDALRAAARPTEPPVGSYVTVRFPIELLAQGLPDHPVRPRARDCQFQELRKRACQPLVAYPGGPFCVRYARDEEGRPVLYRTGPGEVVDEHLEWGDEL